MSKFNQSNARPAAGSSPVSGGTGAPVVNYQGGLGVERGDAKSELFLMAVSDFGGEDTFYEKGGQRVERMAALARTVAAEDPEWVRLFVRWLREDANMRSASLIVGLEGGAAGAGRMAVRNALRRADEPAEALAYWHSQHGRKLPAAVKRGIADAAQVTYNERGFAKYDSSRSGYRFADVIELTHPKPIDIWQSDLFKYAIDSRHRETEVPASLSKLRTRDRFFKLDKDEKLANVAASGMAVAGLTWENVTSAVGSDAKTWEAVIPTMGYMALLRNLRNFEQAGVSDAMLNEVARRISDPEEVARSKQLPLRFLSAFRNTPSLRFKYPLERALQYSLANVPVLRGRTLVLVDRSGSMFNAMSRNSTVSMADTAAIFGAALAMRAEHPTLVIFGSEYMGRPGSQEIDVPSIGSLLPLVEAWPGMGGTDTEAAVRRHFAGHDRVVLLTDEQHSGHGMYWTNAGYRNGSPLDAIPATVPVYIWNLVGYKPASGEDRPNRIWMGGLTDLGFQTIPLIEAGRDARWPWENGS